MNFIIDYSVSARGQDWELVVDFDYSPADPSVGIPYPDVVINDVLIGDGTAQNWLAELVNKDDLLEHADQYLTGEAEAKGDAQHEARKARRDEHPEFTAWADRQPNSM